MAEPPILNQDISVKKRAIRRLAVALILIAAAILGLTLVDKLTVEDKPKPRANPTIAIAPPPPPSTAVTPPAPETPAPPPTPQAESPPTATTPKMPAPPPPEVSRVPDLRRAPSTPAVPPKAATPPPVSVVPAPKSAAPPAPAPVASAPSQKPAVAASPAPAPAPATSSTPAKPTPGLLKLEEATPPPIPPGKGYTVQMGVFNTYANADALLAKLKERGVPAYTETRVVVGPFRTRMEAAKAAATLKELGAGNIVRPAKK